MELKQFFLNHIGLIISLAIVLGTFEACHNEAKRCEQFLRELREKEMERAEDESTN